MTDPQSKTIRQVLELAIERGIMQETGLTNTTLEQEINQALSDISKIIDEAKPDKIVYFADIKPPFDGQTDLSYLKGRAVGHNLAIDQYHSNLKERLK